MAASNRIKRLLKWLLVTGLVLALLGVIAVAGIFWFYGRDLPQFDGLDFYQPKQVTRVYAGSGELIAQWVDDELIYRTVLTFDEMPEVIRDAVVAAEDADFYDHVGVDLPGVLRAIWFNVRHGSMRQGFSSITQQVVKNLILTPEQTIRRKVQEVLLAFRLEEQLTKDEILTIYMNEVYLGANRYGVEEACRYYFGHSIDEVTLPEAALLAGLLPSPARYNPYAHPERALERREYVLRQMWEKGFIEESLFRTAMEAPLELADNAYPHLGEAPHFVAAVRRMLIEALGETTLLTGGLRIETTVDLTHQRMAEDALRETLREFDERNDLFEPTAHRTDNQLMTDRLRTRVPRGFVEGEEYEVAVFDTDGETLLVGVGDVDSSVRLVPYDRIAGHWEGEGHRYSRGDVITAVAHQTANRQVVEADPMAGHLRLPVGPEAGFVAIDPATRRVLALVGGYDYAQSSYDRATQARRPTGSAFKPFVYAAALEAGFVTPASLVRDEPAPFRLPGGRTWNPQNADGEYLGMIPLRTALARSRNVVSVRLLEEAGLERARRIAASAGIETALTDNLTAALGSTEMPVIELVNAYATLASGGLRHDPIIVTRVTNRVGDVVWEHPYQPVQGIDPALAYVVTSMMTSVVQRGTARAAAALERPAAGKTGTTNDARDAWFVGFTPQLVAGGWVGYDDFSPLGRREYGGRAALPMWLAYMQEALDGEPVLDFEPPEGVVTRAIDPETGLLANPGQEGALDEVFIEGSEPTRYAPTGPDGDDFGAPEQQQPGYDDF